MSSKREQIIETTCQLIELLGYHATGLNQIVAESGAPKGSLYHYFPDGKDGLIEEAINCAGQIIAGRLREGMDAYISAAEAIPAFLRTIAFHVQASDFQVGGPITAVALEAASTNERLNAACHHVYQSWQAIIEQKLIMSGYETVRAKRLASMIVSLIEGATILSRSEHDVAPLLNAATELEVLLQ